MENVDLYYFPPSAPCRAVLLLVKALGLMINLKTLNIMEGEQMQPDFLKLNPQHTIPTLVDNGFVLWESRAILKYLENEFDEEHKYTPSDSKTAARVDHLLFFDIGTLYQRFMDYYVPVIFRDEKPDPEKAEKVEEALKLLDGFLENNDWVAGPQTTVADFSLIATVSTMDAVGMDINRFSNVAAWYERMKTLLEPFDYQKVNQEGATMFGNIFKEKAKTN